MDYPAYMFLRGYVLNADVSAIQRHMLRSGATTYAVKSIVAPKVAYLDEAAILRDAGRTTAERPLPVTKVLQVVTYLNRRSRFTISPARSRTIDYACCLRGFLHIRSHC